MDLPMMVVVACPLPPLSRSVGSDDKSLDLSTMDAVFLGGSCGKTTWRQDAVTPVFDAHNIVCLLSFFLFAAFRSRVALNRAS